MNHCDRIGYQVSCRALLAFVGICWLACAPAARRSLRAGTTPKSPENEYHWQSEGVFPPAPAVVPQPARGPEYDKPNRLPTQAKETTGEPVTHVPVPNGFRVQVFAGHSPELAEKVQAEILSLVFEASYIVYLESYYKVRVGDCHTFFQCENIRDRLRAAGYPSAWIVKTRINR